MLRRLSKKIGLVFFFLYLMGSYAYSGGTNSGRVFTPPGTAVSGANVQVLGTTLNSSTLSDGTYSLSLPDNSTYILKVTRSGYLPTYTVATFTGTDEQDTMLLTQGAVDDFCAQLGAISESGKGHLALLTFDPATGGKIYGATAIIRDLKGNPPTGITIGYIENGGIVSTPDSTSGTGTFGFFVFNLSPGTYMVSASKSGEYFQWRPATIYPGSITSGASVKDGILKSPQVIDFSGTVTDENSNSVSSTKVSFVGTTFSDTSNSNGNFVLSGIPLYSGGFIKTSENAYKDTYQFSSFDGSNDHWMVLSNAFFTDLTSQAGVTADQTKGHLAGDVMSLGKSVSGAQVEVMNEDGTASKAKVFYLNSAGTGIDTNLGTTSQSGVFLIFNLSPQTPIFLKATKTGIEFPLVVTQTWEDGFTLSDIGSGGGLDAEVMSLHEENDYYAEFWVGDADQKATSITVTGPGISGTANMVYHADEKGWRVDNNPFLGADIPTGAVTYNFNITTPSGTSQVSRTITGYVKEFATNLSPSGNTTLPLTFSWTGINEPGATYGVELYDGNSNRIWEIYHLSNSPILYSGPALTVGKSYLYDIISSVSTGGQDNISLTQGSFTVGTQISGTVSLSGVTAGVTDVLLTLSGNSSSTTHPNSQGRYSFAGLPEGTYTVTPSLTDYTFSPVNRTYSPLNSDQTGQNFVGSSSGQLLQFSSSAYSVSEGGDSVTITVVRTGGSAGTITVDYATSDGTATAGSDYITTSNTLTFSDGETSKTFSVSIIDDSVVEEDETVNLTLSNPMGGAGLGSPSVAVLTIVDNDDQVAPTTTHSLSGTSGNNGWYTSPVTVTLAATDNPGGSGVNKSYIRVGSNNAYQEYSSPFVINDEGELTVDYYSDDRAGNQETPRQVQLKIDKTAPSFSNEIPSNGTTTVDTTPAISVDITDTHSGVDSSTITMTVNGGPVTPTVTSITSGYRVSYTPTTPLPFTQVPVPVEVTADDNAGNQGGPSWSFKVSREIQLNIGWNLIALPWMASYKAQDILQDILDANSQPGKAMEIDRWLKGTWEGHLAGVNFNNFAADVGKGYFVKCSSSGTWTISGSPISSLEIPLAIGWNLVGIPLGTYKAQDVCDEINSQGGKAVEIDRWHKGTWEGHLAGVNFNNFAIEKSKGYFLKCTKASTWSVGGSP